VSMSCQNCGSGQNLCSYDTISKADYYRKVSSAGMSQACSVPNSETFHNDLPYLSAGRWKITLVGGSYVQVNSKCHGGAWSATLPGGGAGIGANLLPANCLEIGEESVDLLQNNCAGFHRITITLFAGGGWLKVEEKITVKNNGNCD
jgi:hypothetical protein